MNHPSTVSLLGRFVAMAGSVCLLGPLAAFVFSGYTFARQFDEVARTGQVVPSDRLTQEVHSVFTATGVGLVLGLLGVALGCIALLVFRFVPTWQRNIFGVGAFFLLFAPPLGTAAAVVLFLALRRLPQNPVHA